MFDDIVVLASRPRPLVDPDDVKHIQPISFKLYMGVYIPLWYFAIEICQTTNQPNDTLYPPNIQNAMTRLTSKLHSLTTPLYPQIFEMQYLHD